MRLHELKYRIDPEALYNLAAVPTYPFVDSDGFVLPDQAGLHKDLHRGININWLDSGLVHGDSQAHVKQTLNTLLGEQSDTTIDAYTQSLQMLFFNFLQLQCVEEGLSISYAGRENLVQMSFATTSPDTISYHVRVTNPRFVLVDSDANESPLQVPGDILFYFELAPKNNGETQFQIKSISTSNIFWKTLIEENRIISDEETIAMILDEENATLESSMNKLNVAVRAFKVTPWHPFITDFKDKVISLSKEKSPIYGLLNQSLLAVVDILSAPDKEEYQQNIIQLLQVIKAAKPKAGDKFRSHSKIHELAIPLKNIASKLFEIPETPTTMLPVSLPRHGTKQLIVGITLGILSAGLLVGGIMAAVASFGVATPLSVIGIKIAVTIAAKAIAIVASALAMLFEVASGYLAGKGYKNRQLRANGVQAIAAEPPALAPKPTTPQ